MDFSWINFGSLSLLLIGGVGWLIKQSRQEHNAIQEKLRDQQRALYVDLLQPFIMILVAIKSDSDDSKTKAVEFVNSFEYRQKAARFSFYASDEVVRAFSLLWQTARNAEVQPNPQDMLMTLGALMLAMRKSLGHRSTTLSAMDMLECLMPGSMGNLAELEKMAANAEMGQS